MRSRKSKLRTLAVGLIVILLTTLLPGSALASIKVKVNVKKMPVYVNYNGQVRQATIPKDTVLKVTAVRDGVALFRYNGYYCIGQVKNMSEINSDTVENPLPAGGEQRAVTKVTTYVFQQPTTRSAYVKVKKGTQMTVLAVKGDIAQVKKNGVIAYAYRKHLLMESEATQDDLENLKDQLEAEQNQAKLPSVTEAFKSGNYSNEQLCYLFLTQVMGYNTAAAAGVLANINYESGFKTTLYGDGSTSYGICQWHLERRTRLINYCKQYGVSADSLVGQLAYLKYELENFYPMVHRYMLGVSNTPEGAYDAAYFFCYNFEAPAARESQSVKRGSSAQSTYYGRYATI